MVKVSHSYAVCGQILWQWLFLGQYVLLAVICPGLTAGAISTERERGTLELLFLTPLTPAALVIGKFFGAIGEIFLVLCAGLPIMATTLSFFGGVSWDELLSGYAMLLSFGALFAAIGVLYSIASSRTRFAYLWSYTLVLVTLPPMLIPLIVVPTMYLLPMLMQLTTLAVLCNMTTVTVFLCVCSWHLRRMKWKRSRIQE